MEYFATNISILGFSKGGRSRKSAVQPDNIINVKMNLKVPILSEG